MGGATGAVALKARHRAAPVGRVWSRMRDLEGRVSGAGFATH